MIEPASLDALYRQHASSLIARLVRVAGGRVDWAETAVHDAFVRAAAHFDTQTPVQPEAWLYRVARNRLIDLARHEQVRLRLHDTFDATPVTDAREPALASEWDDELLQMIVATCHPALTSDEQVALALRILCGLSRASIALLFRAEEETIKKRLTSAKRKLREQASITAPLPTASASRLRSAMRVLYVVFAEGHKPRSGEHALRADLCAEAIGLVEVLIRKAPSDLASLHALAALMKFGAARLPARVAEGAIVLLEHQDRRQWNGALIDAALVHLRHSAQGSQVTPYHLEATIGACHCLAPDFASTDWGRIVDAYDALAKQRPSVMVEVNRAVAIGFFRGFDDGIAQLRTLPAADVVTYLPYHAALASLAERAGERALAASAYRVALNLSRVAADRQFFSARLAATT